jgi:hypothetical protein
VARPHHSIWAGDSVTLDGSKSWSASGKVASFRWQFSDSTTSDNPLVKRTYAQPARYSEVLRIADEAGNVSYDFGDGSEPIEVQSDGNAVKLAPNGYAVTAHRYAKPGDYVVRVSRTNEHGVTAAGHLHVHISAP